ncbi:MAG: aspartate 1-decarboxylase [Deltaproteobacteria bacterium]|nr:aspartate 1-decarboxylase [Deltaproteobacteria bacterium]MBW2052543.1 aspartate 1-decarboxylase [Deltaproteobacteria bacterium]MBW2322277.1 aspartate 1-decarboxylase [Deltaproteobacteria bacterium]
MQRVMLKSKVHRATVTQADLHYEGSLTLDTLLMDAANLLPFEKIQVLNVTNGERFETYVIEGEPGSGVVCLNGAAARKGARGDLVILVSYAVCSEDEARDSKPDLVFVDEKNRMVRKMSGHDEVIIDKASLNLA